MIRNPNSLNGLIAIRQRKEESEERSLASLTHQLRQARSRHEQTLEEAATARTLRLEEIHHREDGAHHHRWEVRMREIRRILHDGEAQITALEETYQMQMQRYLAARRDREIISELQQRYAARWAAELQSREQKRYDELFLIRFVRNCDSSV